MQEISRLLAGDSGRDKTSLAHVFADVDPEKVVGLQLGLAETATGSYHFDRIDGSDLVDLIALSVLGSDMQLVCLSGLVAIANTN